MQKPTLNYILTRTPIVLLAISFLSGTASLESVASAFGFSQRSTLFAQLMMYMSIIAFVMAFGYVIYRRVQHFVRQYVGKRIKENIANTDAMVSAAVSELHKVQKESVDGLRAEMRQGIAATERRCQQEGLHRLFRFALRNGECDGLFSREELRIMSAEFDQYDALTVYWLLSTYDAFDILPLTPRRRLATDLRGLGYLSKSQKVFESVTGLTKSDRDLSVYAYRQGELKVYNGEYQSKLAGRRGSLNRNPGHVLHVVARALPGVQSGYTLRTHYTAMAQMGCGLRVSVVSQVGEAPLSVTREKTTIAGVDYYTLPGEPKSSLPWNEWLDANISELVSVVEEVRPAVIHAHSDFFNAISAQAVGDYFGIPVVYESRGFWEESWLSRTEQRFGVDWGAMEAKWGLPEAYTLRKAREDEVRRGAARVFTLARVMKERIVLAGVSEKRVSLVPNAVKSEHFPVMKRDAILAEAIQVPKDCVTVGYISSIVEYEGIDTLIEAYGILARSVGVPVQLIIVGDGPVLPGLKKKVNDAGLEGVLFAGKVSHEDVLKYYSLIDIFVVPRRPAAVCQLVTPLKPFEAFSTGRAVVMSDVAALREIAVDSHAAELFAAGDERSLAEVLGRLVRDPARRAELGRRGAEWVRQERTWESNCDEYLRVYKELGVCDLDPSFGSDASGVHS